MKKVIVVFGDFSEDVAELISGNYDVIKTEKNLDGLLALSGKLVEPDVLLTDGTVLSIMNEGRINRSQNMLLRLEKIRSMWPKTKIILILPGDAPDNLVQAVAYLGIYNIYRFKSIRQKELLGCIEQEKDYSSVSAPILTKVEHIQNKPSVEKEPAPEENKNKGTSKFQIVSNNKFTQRANKAVQNFKVGTKFSDSINTIKSIVNETFTKLERISFSKEENNENANSKPPCRVIAVWNPLGTLKSYTALNLAVINNNSGLINLDLTCPELDIWFEIKQTKIHQADEKDAGILTMGESMSPALVPKMLRQIKWGVRYLPAGNKMGNIGTPDYSEGGLVLFKEIIQRAREEVDILVIDAGRDFEYPSTFAALSEADIILIPLIGLPHETEIISQQLAELKRVNVEKSTVELFYTTNSCDKLQQVCQKRIELSMTHKEMFNSLQGMPYCLNEGRNIWIDISKKVNSWG